MALTSILGAAAAVLAGLLAEFRLFAPGREPRRGEAIGWLAFAAAAASVIALTGGPVGEWTTVYLIERSLSLDNVFLFTLLLAYFAVPSELRAPVIIVGIVGALALRGVAIVAGLALVEAADAVVYAFGALLLYIAYRDLPRNRRRGGSCRQSGASPRPAGRADHGRLPRPPAARARGWPAEQAVRRPPRCPPALAPATPGDGGAAGAG